MGMGSRHVASRVPGNFFFSSFIFSTKNCYLQVNYNYDDDEPPQPCPRTPGGMEEMRWIGIRGVRDASDASRAPGFLFSSFFTQYYLFYRY